jgi:glycosyltransferase involved in cell wall biosynthesis
MHVRIIHQYFRTPGEGGGLRTWYIGKYLVSQGYQVSIITAGNTQGYRTIEMEGMNIHYLPVYYSNHLKFLSRVHAFWRFVWHSLRLLNKLPKADVHYILTTPLTTGIIGLVMKKFRKIPYLFEVGDIWPLAPHQLGVLTNPILLRLACWLEQKSYDNAHALVGLSPQISNYLKKRNLDKDVFTIPNISDTEFFKPCHKPSEIIEKYGVGNSFVISYIGTLGLANHLDYLIESVTHLPKAMNVQVLIMGEGAQRKQLERLVKSDAPVHFLPQAGRNVVREVMSITDAIYISFKDIPVLQSGSPNKLFDGLASGKLIIINFHGWVKELIETTCCGKYHNPHDPESLQSLLEEFIDSPVMLSTYQRNARKLAEERFSQNKILPVLVEALNTITP